MRNGLFAISDDFPGKLPLAEGLPAKGIEPSHSCDHWILSPARLPVPPRRRRSKRVRNYKHQPKAQELPIRSESTARKLSGGAKISRRTMASRKPDGDLRNAAISFSRRAGATCCCVAAAYAAAGVVISGGGSAVGAWS